MIDSTNPRVMADNIRYLSDKQIVEAAEILALTGDIEALGSYSTTEVNTGKKWMNSPIYRKVFTIEHLPNNTTDSKPHGIENLGTVVYLGGVVQNVTGYAGRPIPYAGSPTIRFTNTNIEIQAQSDLSETSAIIVMEYTKSAAPTPDVLPSPDPDSRSLEEPEPEEPINEEPKKEEK